LMRIAGVAHLISLTAILYAPANLRWNEELSRLPRLLRQMCNAYQAYTTGTIVALGLVSLFCASELIGGGALARVVCGYIALFWAARLVLQFTYDFAPHLKTAALKIGYHGLTGLFVVFVAFYGWLAVR
ncbi:MAG: hypothetical protein ABW223_07525, partial [Rariglobus sp.]